MKNLDIEVLNYIKNIKNKEFLDRLKTINEYIEKLDKLKELPLIKQRSPEWFELRKSRLTASDLGDAISSDANILRLAKKKAGVYIDDTNYSNIPALKWGTMFEEMASRSYSEINNDIFINEFGLIADKNLEHFGASPDGISELGIMIEIKCPYSREIKENFIPPKYYLQIQGQLAVCELNECDYVECKFEKYDDEKEYLNDTEIKDSDITKHGVIAEYRKDDSFYYLYSEEKLTKKEAIDNINKQKTIKEIEDKSIKFVKFTYWKLCKILIQRVYFNKNEWNTIIPKINKFWDKVEECKKLPIEYKTSKYKFIEDKEDKEDKEDIKDNDDKEVINKIKYLFINDDE